MAADLIGEGRGRLLQGFGEQLLEVHECPLATRPRSGARTPRSRTRRPAFATSQSRPSPKVRANPMPCSIFGRLLKDLAVSGPRDVVGLPGLAELGWVDVLGFLRTSSGRSPGGTTPPRPSRPGSADPPQSRRPGWCATTDRSAGRPSSTVRSGPERDVVEGPVGLDHRRPSDRLAVDHHLDRHRPRLADPGPFHVPVRLRVERALFDRPCRGRDGGCQQGRNPGRDRHDPRPFELPLGAGFADADVVELGNRPGGSCRRRRRTGPPSALRPSGRS